MAKHTPGPWKVRKEWQGDGKEVYPDVKVKIGQPSELCVVDGIYEECAANARLIAAAPDLLAKCVKVVDWLDKLAAASESNASNWKDRLPALAESCVADAKNYRRTADDVRAAIAKATGSAA